MMKPVSIPVLMAVTAFASAAWAQSPPLSDAQFVQTASVGNTFEVEEAKLALDRSSDARLKTFAQKMITDHGAAEKALQDVAGKAGIKADMTLDKPHQAMLDNLRTFNGTDFDKIYTADQIAAHAEAVALLSDYKQNGQTRALQSWGGDTLPVVKQHRAMIDAM